MKKNQPKRQRIPRRGPGVAELEKILKEQEKGQHSDNQFQDISPPPSPPPSSPSPVPFLPPQDYSSSSNLPLFPTLDLIPPVLPTAAAAGPVFPTTPKPDTHMIIPPHFFPNFQFSSLNRPYYKSMVNFNPSSYPSATSAAAKYFHQIVEHPSSQRSKDFNHMLWTSPEEQEQMASGKRGRSFLDENPNIECTRIPNFSNILALKDSSSSSSSSFEINRTNINFHSNFRDKTKRGFSGQLIMSSTKSSGGYQLAEDRSNLMAQGSSSTPNQFAPFDNNFQETMEASQHRDEGGSASDYNKTTYNSLYESNSKLKGDIVATIGSEAEAEAKAEGDGIDLDLKL